MTGSLATPEICLLRGPWPLARVRVGPEGHELWRRRKPEPERRSVGVTFLRWLRFASRAGPFQGPPACPLPAQVAARRPQRLDHGLTRPGAAGPYERAGS